MKNPSKKTQPTNNKFNIEVNYLERIKQRAEAGEYIEGSFLSKALKNDRRTRDLDPIALKYICDFLEGKITKTKGRKPEDKNHIYRRNMFIRYKYARYLKWLQNRRKTHGHLKGWSILQVANFWKGPPNERAARMVAIRLFHGAESYRRIQNIISSQK